MDRPTQKKGDMMNHNNSGAAALPTAPLFLPVGAVPAGRWLGLGMLLVIVLGIYSNFQLQGQVFAAPGFLANAAGMPLHVGAIAMIGLVVGLISLAIAAALRGLYGQQQPLLSRFYLALVVAGLATTLIEGSLVMAMRTLSEAFLASGSDSTAYEPARALLRGLRNGIHYSDKLLGGISVAMMFLLLYRAHAIPSALAVAGMLAGVLQWISIGRALFGMEVMHELLAPLGLVFMATSVWLMVKGLALAPRA